MIGGRFHAAMFARELGVDLVLVHEPGKYEDEFTEQCEQIVHANVADGREVTKALAPLHRRRPFDRVISTTDLGTVPAGEVTDALGLPGNGARAARTLKDKSLTRQTMMEHGLNPVRYRVARSGRDVEELLGEVGGRVVVKPLDASGSAHVHVVSDGRAANRAWSELLAAGYTDAIAEEYLEGALITVEAFSAGGRHLTVAVTEETINEHYTEIGVTAPGRGVERHAPGARELTERLLDAVGIVEGPSHTELIVTADGPRILESHNRMAGVGIPELVRRAYGVNESRWFLSVTLGLEELPEESPQPIGGAAIRFFVPPPGTIRQISGLDQIDATVLRVRPGAKTFGFPGLFDDLAAAEVGVAVQMNEGDVVPEVTTGWDLRMGYVIASAADADAAVARCDEVLEAVRFHSC
jgi:biotin carboxylase